MEASIKINTDNLGPEILEAIKKMFPHKNVEITVQYADETEYILSNEPYANELSKRIEEYRKLNTKKQEALKKYKRIMSGKHAEKLQEHAVEVRNEWDRNF